MSPIMSGSHKSSQNSLYQQETKLPFSQPKKSIWFYLHQIPHRPFWPIKYFHHSTAHYHSIKIKDSFEIPPRVCHKNEHEALTEYLQSHFGPNLRGFLLIFLPFSCFVSIIFRFLLCNMQMFVCFPMENLKILQLKQMSVNRWGRANHCMVYFHCYQLEVCRICLIQKMGAVNWGV